MKKNLQESLLESIQIMVDETIKKTSYTSSHVGVIREINGFSCMVEIYGSQTECRLMEHLHNVVKVGDIVVVQDLYNDNNRKFVQSKIGEAKL